MQALSWLRRLIRSERGNVIVIGATVMPLMIGAGAVGLDTIQYNLWKRQLQRAADSAALAGGRALVQKRDAAIARAAAARDLELNNPVPLLGAAVIQPPPLAGAWTGNADAVRVVLRSQQSLPFWSFFTGTSPTLEVSATAAIVKGGRFCMFATESGNVTAIMMTGNSKLNLGCGIAANSTANPAIDAKGSTEVNAAPIIAPGGLDPNNSKYGTTDLQPHSAVQENPFEDLADPSEKSAGLNCDSDYDPANKPADGGRYCFKSMNINEIHALPSNSTIYIKNGSMNLGTKARVTGDQVTIVFTGTGDSIGKFDMQGQAELDLRAPKITNTATSIDYPGMAMIRDDGRLNMDILQINGGQELKIEGAMYFPKTRLFFNGNSDLSASCLQIVAQQLEFKGGANITNDCKDEHGKSFAATYVRLVE